MCRRCRNETLPRLKLPSWQRDVLRKAADGMLAAPDPKAEKIKRRKGRNMTRATFAAVLETVKLRIIGTDTIVAETPSEECDTCLRLQARAA